MTGVRYSLFCPKCGNPLSLSEKVTRDFTESYYKCLRDNCGFSIGVRGNEHMQSLKNRLGKTWDGLVGYYDQGFNVPYDRSLLK